MSWACMLPCIPAMPPMRPKSSFISCWDFKAFARWYYRQLENEYEYLNSDESVDDLIRANEYTFTESGKLEG